MNKRGLQEGRFQNGTSSDVAYIVTIDHSNPLGVDFMTNGQWFWGFLTIPWDWHAAIWGTIP